MVAKKTHNDAIRNFLGSHGIDHTAIGFASIQLDGGIDRVTDKVTNWFASFPACESPRQSTLCLGLTAQGDVPAETATALATEAASIVASGGSVILPETSPMLRSTDFTTALFVAPPHPTLSYGEIIQHRGLHVMAMSGDHLIESLSGMGSSGANLFLVHDSTRPVQGHPFIPTVQIASDSSKRCLHKSKV
jgi:hypothetical protein